MGTMDAIEFINSKLKETKSNADFFSSMNKPANKFFNNNSFIFYQVR